MSALDEQVGGSHYKTLKMQPLEHTYLNYGYQGLKAAVHTKVDKYLLRSKDDEVEQIEKAIHCLEILRDKAEIEREEWEQESRSEIEREKFVDRFIQASSKLVDGVNREVDETLLRLELEKEEKARLAAMRANALKRMGMTAHKPFAEDGENKEQLWTFPPDSMTSIPVSPRLDEAMLRDDFKMEDYDFKSDSFYRGVSQ